MFKKSGIFLHKNKKRLKIQSKPKLRKGFKDDLSSQSSSDITETSEVEIKVETPIIRHEEKKEVKQEV